VTGPLTVPTLDEFFSTGWMTIIGDRPVAVRLPISPETLVDAVFYPRYQHRFGPVKMKAVLTVGPTDRWPGLTSARSQTTKS
jgi:hypothetical protein